MEEKYKKFFDVARVIYQNEGSGHDFSHIERVISSCREIMKEVECDQDVVIISALFHDLHRVKSHREGKFVSAEEAMPYVREVLSKLNLEKSVLEKVLFVIEQHDNKKSREEKPIELQIVQDADILDSLGDVGLSRTLTYCKRYNIPLVDKRFDLDCEQYIPDINPISTLHYVWRTMIPNHQLLHTEKAKKMGQGLVKQLEKFVKENLN